MSSFFGEDCNFLVFSHVHTSLEIRGASLVIEAQSFQSCFWDLFCNHITRGSYVPTYP